MAPGARPPVRLSIPADARFLRVARLTAAAIAGDLDFTVEDIEDLRVAVDEACAVLIDGERSDDAVLDLAYREADGGLVIEGATTVGAGTVPELHVVAAEVLAMTADACDFATDERQRTFTLRKEPSGQGA